LLFSTIAIKRLNRNALFNRILLGVEFHQTVKHLKYGVTDNLFRILNARTHSLC